MPKQSPDRPQPMPRGKKAMRRKRPQASQKNKSEDNERAMRRQMRKHLDERLRVLYERAMVLERELRHLDDNRYYRVCIFGSARIKPDTEIYQQVFNVARYLAWEGVDILTGGGPGLMEAANRGAHFGQQERKTRTMSYGLPIDLPFEPEENLHLDIKRHHHKFSSRLDDFMRLSHAIVVTPGGIGTLLELYFSWQLIQVKHIETRPIVLLGSTFWGGLIDWMKQYPLARGLISPRDFEFVSIVETPEEAAEVISAHHKKFRQNPEYCRL